MILLLEQEAVERSLKIKIIILMYILAAGKQWSKDFHWKNFLNQLVLHKKNNKDGSKEFDLDFIKIKHYHSIKLSMLADNDQEIFLPKFIN